MALSALAVWEVRTTGNDLNGGGYVSGGGGTDYSQQDAAQVTLDGSSVKWTTSGAGATITLAGVTGVAAHVGNIVQIPAGTNVTAGFYQITGYTSSSWTLDRACCTGAVTDGAGRMGGALASPGMACGAKANGNTVYVKAGTYTISSASENVSGGKCNFTGASGARSTLIGYGSDRSDRSTRPLLQVAATGVTNITVLMGNQYTVVDNFEIDGAGKTGITGYDSSSYNSSLRIKTRNTTANSGLAINSVGMYCEATSHSGLWALNIGGIAMFCSAHDNPNSTAVIVFGYAIACAAYRNAGVGFAGGNVTGTMLYCTSAYNSSHGVSVAGNSTTWFSAISHCIAYGNGGYGFYADGRNPGLFRDCAGGSNTSGNYHSNLVGVERFTALTASPFIDASATANGASNFGLNDTAGGGAAVKNAGNATIPGSSTVSYLDIGCADHQDPASGAMILARVHLGM